MKSINKIPVRNIVIIGENRQEFCVPQKKDVDGKQFFQSRGQLYHCFPYEISQCIWTFHNRYIGQNEVIVYPEDGIHPHIEHYKTKMIKINSSRYRQKIDEQKSVSQYKLKPRKMVGWLTQKNQNVVRNLLPFAIVGQVLMYAFLKNGF